MFLVGAALGIDHDQFLVCLLVLWLGVSNMMHLFLVFLVCDARNSRRHRLFVDLAPLLA